MKSSFTRSVSVALPWSFISFFEVRLQESSLKIKTRKQTFSMTDADLVPLHFTWFESLVLRIIMNIHAFLTRECSSPPSRSVFCFVLFFHIYIYMINYICSFELRSACSLRSINYSHCIHKVLYSQLPLLRWECLMD